MKEKQMLTDNFKDNFSFNGVSTRSQYWETLVITFVALIIVTIAMEGSGGIGVILALVALIAIAWVMLAVTVKRCHDIGINAWWTAATLIPFIGSVVTIVLGCLSTKRRKRTI